jgi:hypothetical protein
LTIRISSVSINPNDRFTKPNADVVSFPGGLNVTDIAVKTQDKDLEISISGREADFPTKKYVRNRD